MAMAVMRRRKRGCEWGYFAGWWSGPMFARASRPSEQGTPLKKADIVHCSPIPTF